jgi:hypothetical protein
LEGIEKGERRKKRKGRKENTERTGNLRGNGREKITGKGTCERREI